MFTQSQLDYRAQWLDNDENLFWSDEEWSNDLDRHIFSTANLGAMLLVSPSGRRSLDRILRQKRMECRSH